MTLSIHHKLTPTPAILIYSVTQILTIAPGHLTPRTSHPFTKSRGTPALPLTSPHGALQAGETFASKHHGHGKSGFAPLRSRDGREGVSAGNGEHQSMCVTDYPSRKLSITSPSAGRCLVRRIKKACQLSEVIPLSYR